MTSVATVDPAAPALVQQMTAVRSAVQGLGTTIAGDAASGDFAGILTAIQGVTSEIDDPSATADASAAGSTGGTSAAAGGLGTFGAHLLDGTVGSTSTGVRGSDVVADAATYVGVPYQWGGTSPTTGFDCSGLVQHVYGDLGVSLPRTSQEQSTVGQPVTSLAQAKPGDLLFFEPGPSGPGHVGIYIGNGEMIDAPHTGTTVQVQSAGTPCAIRRVLPNGGGMDFASLATSGLTGASGSSGTGTPTALGIPSELAPLFL